MVRSLESTRALFKSGAATAADAAAKKRAAAVGDEDPNRVSTMGAHNHHHHHGAHDPQHASSWKAWETRASAWWSNTTEVAYRYWEESGRSKIKIKVELLVDAAKHEAPSVLLDVQGGTLCAEFADARGGVHT